MRSLSQQVARARAFACAALPPLVAWAKRRAAEKSTWVGLAAVASAFGKSVLADRLTSMGDVVPMIVGGLGAALVTASTSRKAA